MGSNKRFIKAYSSGTIETSEVWVDTETGVNYFFHTSGYAGGLTPLLNREGNPVVSSPREIDDMLKKH